MRRSAPFFQARAGRQARKAATASVRRSGAALAFVATAKPVSAPARRASRPRPRLASRPEAASARRTKSVSVTSVDAKCEVWT